MNSTTSYGFCNRCGFMAKRVETNECYVCGKVRQARAQAFRDAAEIAGFDSMKCWIGGSTGNAVMTADNIVAALRAKAEELEKS